MKQIFNLSCVLESPLVESVDDADALGASYCALKRYMTKCLDTIQTTIESKATLYPRINVDHDVVACVPGKFLVPIELDLDKFSKVFREVKSLPTSEAQDAIFTRLVGPNDGANPFVSLYEKSLRYTDKITYTPEQVCAFTDTRDESLNKIYEALYRLMEEISVYNNEPNTEDYQKTAELFYTFCQYVRTVISMYDMAYNELVFAAHKPTEMERAVYTATTSVEDTENLINKVDATQDKYQEIHNIPNDELEKKKEALEDRLDAYQDAKADAEANLKDRKARCIEFGITEMKEALELIKAKKLEFQYSELLQMNNITDEDIKSAVEVAVNDMHPINIPVINVTYTTEASEAIVDNFMNGINAAIEDPKYADVSVVLGKNEANRTAIICLRLELKLDEAFATMDPVEVSMYQECVAYEDALNEDYCDMLDCCLILEDTLLKKGVDKISGGILKLISMIKDLDDRWHRVDDVKVNKDEKEIVDNTINKSTKLCNNLIENIETGNDISYEVDYEDYIDEVKKFSKAKDAKEEKDETISAQKVRTHVGFLRRIAERAKKATAKVGHKIKEALYIVINRALYVFNKLLYGLSGGGNKAKESDKGKGIEKNRYGNLKLGVKINNLDKNPEIQELIKKMKDATSYGPYKEAYDRVCEIYGKKDVSALKLVDMDNNNKLVFVSYGQLKPYTLKAGTKLYHISTSKTIQALEPRFRSKDDITFYRTPRIYFTDKLENPAKILKAITDPTIYCHTTTEDLTVYRDAEYGSWYHHAIYVESDKNLKVENVTDEVLEKANSLPKNKRFNESASFDSLMESITEFDNFYMKRRVLTEGSTIDPSTVPNSIEGGNPSAVEKSLDSVAKKYERMSEEDQKRSAPIVATIINKTLTFVKKTSGIEMIKSGVADIKHVDYKVMPEFKEKLPSNHVVYNKAKSEFMTDGVKKIILGILTIILKLLAVTAIALGLNKTTRDAIISKCTDLKETISDSKIIKALDGIIEKVKSMGVKNESVGLKSMNESIVFNEETMDTATRKSLDDDEFGLPDARKYPLNDEDHIVKAIQFFHFAKADEKETLAKNITKAVINKKLIGKVHVSANNNFKRFFPEWMIDSNKATAKYDGTKYQIFIKNKEVDSGTITEGVAVPSESIVFTADGHTYM